MDGWNPALKGSIGNSKWNVLADLDSGGSLKTRYLRGDVVDQLFAEMAYSSGTHTTNWTLTDIRGSMHNVVDNSAYVKDSINYGAFGNIFTTGALAETSHTDRGRYAWSGRELDIETGLQYNRADGIMIQTPAAGSARTPWASMLGGLQSLSVCEKSAHGRHRPKRFYQRLQLDAASKRDHQLSRNERRKGQEIQLDGSA